VISFHHLMSGASYVRINNGTKGGSRFRLFYSERLFLSLSVDFFKVGGRKRATIDFCGFTGSLVIDDHFSVVF